MQRSSKIFVAKESDGSILTQPGSTVRIQISSDIGSKNFTAGYLVLNPRSKTKPSIHPNSEEIFYITKGKGIIKVDNEAKEVGEGDLVFISKNLWHEFENIGDNSMEWVLICSPALSEEEYKKSPWTMKEQS